MYQGKFDKKNKGTAVDIREVTAARNAAVAAAQKKTAVKEADPAEQPKKRSAVCEDVQAPVKKAPVQERPSKKAAKEESVQAAPKKKGPRLGGVIFYTLYFLFIFLFFVAVYFGLNWLQGWLVDYEAAQPTTKSAEVFRQLFDDPDWGALYDAAGIADTQYEGKEAFVTYMENLVGDQELTYQLTSTGMSDDVKYFVKLGDKRLAYFTLTGGEKNQGLTAITGEIPEWHLGEVSLFYERANGYRIQTVDGHVPYVNGIALTDDHIIQKSSMETTDTDFIPSGYSSAKSSVYEITGLIAEPTITVQDSAGNQMEVSFDETSGMYVEKAEVISISEEEKNLALNALKVYAKYGIKEASGGEVATYFDPTGPAYKSIIQTVLTWTKGNNGISFDKDTVSNYCRFGDDQFSVYVTTELTIKLTDGGTQTKSINSTLLFTKTGGSWKVTKMTNANIAETVGKVRLTFMNGDIVLQNDFYNINAETLETPLLSVPNGKVFSGWYRETVKENGAREQFLVFVPDENGDVTIPSGTTLEPMVLYPLFEDASAASAVEGA